MRPVQVSAVSKAVGDGGGNCQRVCSRPVGRNHSREAEVAQLDVSIRVE